MRDPIDPGSRARLDLFGGFNRFCRRTRPYTVQLPQKNSAGRVLWVECLSSLEFLGTCRDCGDVFETLSPYLSGC